jgi:hypothetical protein
MENLTFVEMLASTPGEGDHPAPAFVNSLHARRTGEGDHPAPAFVNSLHARRTGEVDHIATPLAVHRPSVR